MQKQTFTLQVNIPSVDEFAAKYRQYGPFARGDAHFLFNVLASPESYIRAEVATLLGHPGIDGPAEMAYQAVAAQNVIQWDDNTKRFCGAVIASLMEANQWNRTGEKKSVKHQAFSKGEFYKRAGSQDDTLPHLIGNDES